MTSNDNNNIVKLTTESHENRTDSSSEVMIKAMNYPPGYPDNQEKEQCNKKDEKHKDCHPMHCHHMQPMQSTTNTSLINKSPDHTQEDSKK